jgi:hypothetical protein
MKNARIMIYQVIAKLFPIKNLKNLDLKARQGQQLMLDLLLGTRTQAHTVIMGQLRRKVLLKS